jgi:hypothetical protein
MKITCAGCGHKSAWRELPAVATLTARDVNAYVLDWPPGTVVEVRACRSCGRTLARSAPCELG